MMKKMSLKTKKQKKLMMKNNKELPRDFNEVLGVYSSILEITATINQEIENRNPEKIPSLLELRGQLIENANKIITKLILSGKEKEEINSLKEKIRVLEKKSISTLEERKTDIKKTLFEIGINKKNISAYKLSDVSEPRLFDETE